MLLFAGLLLLRMRTVLNERKAEALRLYGQPAPRRSAAPTPRAARRAMSRRSARSWLAMGGYAAFVWPAYGVAAAVLGGFALLFLAALPAERSPRSTGCSRAAGRRR